MLIFGIVYLLSYIQRIYQVIDMNDSQLVNTVLRDLSLFGMSLLPFVIGSIFAKESIYSKIYSKSRIIPFKNMICLLGIAILVIIHSIYESLIIAPFTAIPFIILFTLLDKNSRIEKIFLFFGNHSTNIWLTHMFFYLTFLPKVTFAPKYPIFIFAWLLFMCVIASYVINSIYKPVNHYLDKITQKEKQNASTIGNVEKA